MKILKEFDNFVSNFTKGGSVNHFSHGPTPNTLTLHSRFNETLIIRDFSESKYLSRNSTSFRNYNFTERDSYSIVSHNKRDAVRHRVPLSIPGDEATNYTNSSLVKRSYGTSLIRKKPFTEPVTSIYKASVAPPSECISMESDEWFYQYTVSVQKLVHQFCLLHPRCRNNDLLADLRKIE